MTISRLLMLVMLASSILMPTVGVAQERIQLLRAHMALFRFERLQNAAEEDRYSERESETKALEEAEEQERELAVHAAEKKRIDALKSEAERLRREMSGDGMQQQPATNAQDLEELDYSSGLWRWLRGEKQGHGASPTNRTRAQIDERLRENGVTVEVEGGSFTQPFESLAHLEAYVDEETKRVDKLIKSTRENLGNKRAAAAEHEKKRWQLDERLRALDSKVNEWEARVSDETIRRPYKHPDLLGALAEEFGYIRPASDSHPEDSPAKSDPPQVTEARPDYSDLFQAIAEEVMTAPGSGLGQGENSGATSLLGDLEQDRMSREEYELFVDRREKERATHGIDEATRREAAVINQQVAQREQQMWEAEQRYQQAVRQQAAQAELQRRWAQQQASRQQWQQAMQQQQAWQQFGNDLGNLFGGSGAASGAFANPSSRGSYTPSRPSRSHSSASRDGRSGGRKPTSSGTPSSQRQNRNAQGFKDMFSPVTDPNRAQQLKNTFGNRNR